VILDLLVLFSRPCVICEVPPEEKMKNSMIFWAALFFGVFVWPTPYEYLVTRDMRVEGIFHDSVVRINRFTGEGGDDRMMPQAAVAVLSCAGFYGFRWWQSRRK
jgi:hypothetical protein